MKSKINSIFKQSGFTVVELLVVFLIIVALSSIVVVRWNNLSPSRSLNIAQNEFVTQFRKIQSSAISSKNLSTGESVEYYILRLDISSDTYQVDAVDSSDQKVYHSAIETQKLPQGVQISQLVQADGSKNESEVACAWVVISAVYGKIYLFTEANQKVCVEATSLTTEQQAILFNLPQLANYTGDNLRVTLTHSGKNISKPVSIYSLTGKVTIE